MTKEDIDIVSGIMELQKNGCRLDILPEKYKKIRNVVEYAVFFNPWELLNADESFYDDEMVINSAVVNKGEMLQYASERLRENRYTVLKAIDNDGMSLKYAGSNMRNNKAVVLTAIKKTASAFQFASEALRDNPDIARPAVKLDGNNLEYAGETIKKDKKIVLAAVKQNGMALHFAAEELKNDKEVVMAAIKQAGKQAYLPFQWASAELRKDPEVVKKAVSLSGLSIQYVDESYLKDRKTVLSAVKENGCVLGILDGDFRNDFDINLAAVKSNPDALNYIDRKLAGDAENNRKKCKALAKERKVEHIVHFTYIKNLESILDKGILTREDIENGKAGTKEVDCFVTDDMRLDNQENTVSLSITKPNESMFSAKRYYSELDANHWCVIRMKAEDILNHECLFFQHNAACHFYVEDDEDCVKKAERNTVFDFASMFDFSDVTNGLTSDVQAEIMCVGQIPVNEIDSVVFNSEETASAFRSKLEEKEIKVLINKVDTEIDYFV